MLPPLPEDPSPYLAVFGRFHPVLLHAPLGIVPALAALEFGAAMLRRPVPRGAVLALAWLAVLTSGLAIASGLVLAGEGGYDEETVFQHKVSGIALGIGCVLVALLAFRGNRTPLRVSLGMLCILLVPVGHLGGSLTHGADFLFEPLRAKKAAKPGPAPHNDTPGPVPSHPDPDPPAKPDATAGGEFATVVQPILERTCKACHNPDKMKGKLLLTTIEGIQKGGENGDVIVPGKPDDSPLVTRLELPLDDDDHMPPPKKKQPSAEEVRALRAWVEHGAKFD